MNQIIDSILQTDLYKLSMQQCVFHQYPNAGSKYIFKCRNEDVNLGFIADKVREQVNLMSSVRLTNKETHYLTEKLPFLSLDYIDYLKTYSFDPTQVNIENVDKELKIDIEGPWVEAILWEVPLLSVINEVYFSETSLFRSIKGKGDSNLRDKINEIRQYPTLTIAEFGTRRRYSNEWQRYVLGELVKNCPQVVGTSNVKLAMDFNIKPIGTVAHEFIMAHLALVDRLEVAQKRAMHVWLQEYGQNLGTMLSDTFTTKAFLRDFDYVLANAFSGCRHDSGDPISFGHSVIDHYTNLGIDPKTKTIIFSDGLDIPTAIHIYKEFTGLVGVSFGIGTSISNDVGCTPLNIVIKLLELNGVQLVKLSDDNGKTMGDSGMVEKVKKAYGVV